MLLLAVVAIQSGKVTFTATDRLERLLPKLGEQIGRPLTAAGALKGEVMAVASRNLSSEMLLAKIAEAADAEWDQEPKGWRLVRTATKEKAIRSRVREERLALLRKAQGRLKAQLDASATFDLPTAERLLNSIDDWYKQRPTGGGQRMIDSSFAWDKILQSDPLHRTLTRFLAGADLSPLLDLEPGERWVLADPPNRMQFSTGDAGRTALQAFQREDQIWWQAVVRRKPRREIWESRDRSSSDTPRAGSGRVNIIVSKSSYSDGLFFRLWQYNEDGTRLSEAMQEVGFDDDDRRWADSETRKDPPFEASPEALAFARVLSGTKGALTKEWRERLLHPEREEPLALALGPNLAKFAADGRRDLVALLPDEAAQVPIGPGLRKLTRTQYLLTLERSGVVWSDDGVTLTGKVRDPLSLQRNRTNRSDLAKLLGTIAKDEALSLEPLGQFSLRNRLSGFTWLGKPSAEALAKGSTAGWSDVDERMLRFYAGLSPEQRSTLLAGRGLPIQGLRADQREMAEKMTFFSNRPSSASMRNLFRNVKRNGRGTILDITELMPNGFLPESTVRLEHEATLAVLHTWKDFKTGATLARTDDLEDIIQSALVPSGGGWNAYRSGNMRWATGARRFLKFVFDLSPEVAYVRELSEVGMPKASDALPYDNLPEAIRLQIERAVAEEQKRRAAYGVSGRTPPP